MDLKIDADGDLSLDDTGDLEVVEGVEAVAQHVLVRLRFFLGEWFLNTREGVPYHRDVLVKNPDKALIRRLLMAVILGTDGVASVPFFELSVGSNREASITFEFTTDDGATLRFEDFVVAEG